MLFSRSTFNMFLKFFLSLIIIYGCSSGGEDPGNGGGGGPVDPPSEIIPSNLSVNITIEGSDSDLSLIHI